MAEEKFEPIRANSMQLLFLIVAIIYLPTIAAQARTNLSSRQTYRALDAGGALPTELSASHPRQPIWSALQEVQAGRNEQAVRLLQPQAAAQDALALQLTAYAHEQAGDYRAAAQIWREQEDASSLERVAELALENGAIADARDAYEMLWLLAPVAGTNRYARFLERQLNDLHAAEAVLRQSIEKYPHSGGYPYWLTALAANLVQQEKWSAAVQVYDELIPVIPRMYAGDRKPGRVHADMAWALYKIGKYDDALVAVKQALAIQSDPYTLQIAANLYEEIGEEQQAIEVYERWLTTDPQNQNAIEALNRLNAK